MEDKIIQVFLDLIELQKERIKELRVENAAIKELVDHSEWREDVAEQNARLKEERDDWQRRCRESTSQTEGLYKRIKDLESENDLLTQANYKWEQDCDRLTLENEAVRQGNANLQERCKTLESALLYWKLCCSKLDNQIDAIGADLAESHGAQRKAEAAMLAMHEDAELGRLVRAMPKHFTLHHNGNIHDTFWRCGIYQGNFCDDNTPEEAIRSANLSEEAPTGQKD